MSLPNSELTAAQIHAGVDDVQTELDELSQKAADEVVQVEEATDRLRFPLYEKRANLIDRIPHFWGKAWLNHSILGQNVQPNEVNLIFAIKALEIDDFDNMTSFKIRMYFGKNSFFRNDKIEKTLRFVEKAGSTISNIRWKSGKETHQWLVSPIAPLRDTMSEIVKNELYANPVKYYMLPCAHEPTEEEISSPSSVSSEHSEELM